MKQIINFCILVSRNNPRKTKEEKKTGRNFHKDSPLFSPSGHVSQKP